MADKPFDAAGSIIAYERGELPDEETTKLVRHLVETGIARVPEGHYRRAAEALIEANYIPIDPAITADA
jgi:hypothetical protein